MTTTIGFIPVETIAKQVAHVARLQNLTAADLATFTSDDWHVLLQDALAIDDGHVRLSVLRVMMEAEVPDAVVTPILRRAA